MATATIECASFRNGLVRVTADYDTVSERVTQVSVVNASVFDARVDLTHTASGATRGRVFPANATTTLAIPAGVGMRIGRTLEDDGSQLPSIAGGTIALSARVPA